MAADKLTLAQVQDMYGKLPNAKEFFYDWGGANEGLFKLINGFHGPLYDEFMLYITKLGNRHFFLPYLGVLLVYALSSLLLAKIRRKAGTKQRFIMWFGAFIVLSVAFVVNGMVVLWLKDYIEFPRPYAALPAYEVTLVDTSSATNPYQSFPSGHVSFITLMVMGLWPLLSYHMKLFGLFLVTLVAWSRVSLGVHFPADTVGGFLITSCVVFIVRWVVYRILRVFRINCGEA